MAETRANTHVHLRSVLALAIANVRYWRTVAPVVRSELGRWRTQADLIADPALRALALSKLEEEAFNAEAGAMLATLAPASQRANVVEAIVALQVLFDLLDGLTERPSVESIRDAEHLFSAFTEALRPLGEEGRDPSRREPGYLWQLSDAARAALSRLPAAAAVAEAAADSAASAAEAQIRMHAVPSRGTGELRRWAEAKAPGTGLGWRELAAGSASSVLAVHALSSAAADPCTSPRQASEIAGAYLQICVLLTLLDSLTDREQDAIDGEPGYISLYTDAALLARALQEASEHALAEVQRLPHAAQHLMILAGVVAYYSSSAGAEGDLARPLLSELHERLAPLLTPALIVMRAWRLARTIRRARKPWRSHRAGGIS